MSTSLKRESVRRKWLDDLDTKTRARIQARVLRVEQGNLGDCKSLGGTIWELRLDFGPGYRVYFGIQGKSLVILLLGGDKGSQSRDIEQAKTYWKEFLAVKGDSHGSKK